MTEARAAADRAPRSALVELSLDSGRELFRSGKSFFGLSAVFLFFLILVLSMHIIGEIHKPDPIVGVVDLGPVASEMLGAFTEAGINAQMIPDAPTPGGITAVVRVDKERAFVTLNAEAAPRWNSIVRVLEAGGFRTTEIFVVDSDGVPQTDVLRGNLSVVLVTGLLAIAFVGTSVPIVALRQRGTLRLLGTTPLRRMTFVLAQSPVRLSLGLLEGGIVLAVALSQGYLQSSSLFSLPVTFAVGLGLLFAFAYLIGSRATNPDLMLQLVGVLPIVVLFGSGTFISLKSAPDFVQWLSLALPTTWFVQALNAEIAGTPTFLPVPILWLMMAAVAVIVALIAARIFVWGQEDR